MDFSVGLTDVGLKFSKNKGGFKRIQNCVLTSFGLLSRNGTDVLTSYLDTIKDRVKIFPLGTTKKTEYILLLSFKDDKAYYTLYSLASGTILGNKEQILSNTYHFKNPNDVEVEYYSRLSGWIISGSYILCHLTLNTASNTPVSISAVMVHIMAGTIAQDRYFAYPKSLTMFQNKVGILCGGHISTGSDDPQYNTATMIFLYNTNESDNTGRAGNVQILLRLSEDDDWTDLNANEDSLFITGATGIKEIVSSTGEAFSSTVIPKAKIISTFHGGGCNIEFSSGRYVFYAGNESIRVKQTSPQFQGSGLVLAGDAPAVPQLLNKKIHARKLLNIFDYILVLDEKKLYSIKISYQNDKPYFAVYEYVEIDGYDVLDIMMIGLEVYILFRSGDQLILTKMNPNTSIDLNTKVLETTVGKTVTIPDPFKTEGLTVILTNPDFIKRFTVNKAMVDSGIIDLGNSIDRSNLRMGLPIKIVIEPQGELKAGLKSKTGYFSFTGDFDIKDEPFWEAYVSSANQKPEKITPKDGIVDENFSMHIPIPCSSVNEKFIRYALTFIVKQKISIDYIE